MHNLCQGRHEAVCVGQEVLAHSVWPAAAVRHLGQVHAAHEAQEWLQTGCDAACADPRTAGAAAAGATAAAPGLVAEGGSGGAAAFQHPKLHQLADVLSRDKVVSVLQEVHHLHGKPLAGQPLQACAVWQQPLLCSATMHSPECLTVWNCAGSSCMMLKLASSAPALTASSLDTCMAPNELC